LTTQKVKKEKVLVRVPLVAEQYLCFICLRSSIILLTQKYFLEEVGGWVVLCGWFGGVVFYLGLLAFYLFVFGGGVFTVFLNLFAYWDCMARFW